MIVGKTRKGAYFDSVTLMRVGKTLAAMAGVDDASIVMGTQANKEILEVSGLLTSDFSKASDTDLVIVVKAKQKKAADAAIAAVDGLLKDAVKKPDSEEDVSPSSLAGALEIIPEANLALISVAGRYAGDEAMKALKSGMHVMLFSDNVSVKTEVELKKFGAKKGLLVMGPDCGTAIINGVPLAFANVVNRGSIGIVAAAGTGLQEVSCVISNAGGGVSQAIGTGGRDVKKAVGGIMFLEGLKALAADPETKVILLVSKPPSKPVMAQVTKVLKKIRKPVVSMMLGAKAPGDPATLEEAALIAVKLAQGGDPASVHNELGIRDAKLVSQAETVAAKCKKGQRFMRGLFSGGTFCAEAQILLASVVKDIYSNAPAGKALALKNSLKSVKNTVIDLGEDEFTVGRPHPMIDYSLRNRRILEEADDPKVAVILLDVVLGYGSNPDPAAELSDVIRKASRKVKVICSITGTDRDPQNRSRVEKALKSAGAIVLPSNAAACMLAGYIVHILGRSK